MAASSLAAALQGVALKKVTTLADDKQSLKDAVALEKQQNARLRSVDLEAWFNEEIEPFTFKTVFVPITQAEAKAMMAGYWARKQSEKQALQDEDATHLSLLKHKIVQGLHRLGSTAVFAKLSSRSPKDSKACEARAFEMVISRLSALHQEGKPIDPNTIVTTVMSAGIRALRLESAEDVMNCFLTSDRVCEDDIPLALNFPNAWTQHVVLREWVDIPTQGEFRAFIFDGK